MRKRIVWVLMSLICFNMIMVSPAYAEGGQSVETVKSSIVHIAAGFTSNEGKFYAVKNCTGFVVFQDGSESVIATVYNRAHCSTKAIKKYCKKHGISTENDYQPEIKIVVNDSINYEANLIHYSEEGNENICLLEADIMDNYEAASIEDVNSLGVGANVYHLGYGIYDNETGISISPGVINNTDASVNGLTYLQHSAKMRKESSGGPLVNEEGRVVGMCDSQLNVEGEECYYAIPIGTITSILNNDGIIYDSSYRDSVMNSLKEKVEVAKGMYSSSAYKDTNKSVLSSYIDKAEDLMNDKAAKTEDLEEIGIRLIEAESMLVAKMSIFAKIDIGLAIVLAIVLGWLIKLLVKQNQYKKDISRKKQQSSAGADSGNSPSMEATVRSELSGRLYVSDGQVVMLKGSKHITKVGRSKEDNDVCVSGPEISREHLVIIRKFNGFYAKDISKNGSYLNEDPMVKNQEYLLKDRDKIELGNDVFITFVLNK